MEQQESKKEEIQILALYTAHWWNSYGLQAGRFIDAFNKPATTPWDGDKDKHVVAERQFLILAVFNAVLYLRKLNKELNEKGDNSLQKAVDQIEAAVRFQDLRSLRNKNIHLEEYLMGEGKDQKNFYMTKELDGVRYRINAAWTAVFGDKNLFLIGNVDLVGLLRVLKENKEFVLSKTKAIYL